MVFVNGQKFACATCIKGHRSTTCNHGERPLHEIKKKGRPPTQCLHCKELRKAKQVSVKCICGKDEASLALANGMKRTKSLSHDGRVPGSVDIGGEGLLRSFSTDGASPVGSADNASPSVVPYSCGCLEGAVCTCCRDRAGHVVSKPSKSSSSHAVFKNYQLKHSAASIDLGKGSALLHSEDASSLMFTAHSPGTQASQSPDGSMSSSSSLGLTSTLNGAGFLSNGLHIQFEQGSSPGPLGCDQLATSSPLTGQPNQVQTHLGFDPTSSSDFKSDHYKASYPFFPQPMTSYAMSNASDDLGEQGSSTYQDTIGAAPTPMGVLSPEGVSSLYTVMSDFSSPSPSMSMQTMDIASLTSSNMSAFCKSDGPTSSSTTSIPSMSHCSGSPDEAEMGGCGCAISASMCCCGELCACPGCLAYPSNPNNPSILDTTLPPEMLLKEGYDSDSNKNTMINASNTNCGMNVAKGSGTSDTTQKGSCCGTRKNTKSVLNDSSALYSAGSTQALNLSQALSLIEASSQNASTVMDDDVRQALRQGLTLMGHAGMDTVKMQHPTLLGDNGILICGCGCGRPTVDCMDCFRDMCEFVSESRARMMKEELELEMAMNGESDYLADLRLNMNMSMAMNMGIGVDMNMDMNMNMDSIQSTAQTSGQGVSLDHGTNSSLTPLSPYQEQQQGHQLLVSLDQPQCQDHLSSRNQVLSQHGSIEQAQGQNQSQHQDEHQQHVQTQLLEEEQRLRLQLMEQEQMQLSQLQPSILNQLQLDFLDDEDWSFVDEIRTDGPGQRVPVVQRS
ncbi:hypothetical protein BGX34_008171 [Mortierella sp. NVP85]|nr:hypothetical protein BGX34_008171 [Mortierella sp. NVP85]